MTAHPIPPLVSDLSEGVQTRTRLLDWFEADYDVDGAISRLVLRLDQLAARRGIRLYPQTDFWGLKRVVDANRPLGANLSPNVDAAVSAVDAGNAFWLLGIDDQGKPAATQTARHFDWTGTTMSEEMESLRFFFADPDRHRDGRTYCRIPRPDGDLISGPVVHSGTMWVRPDFRGPGDVGIVMSQILGRLIRLISLSRWRPGYLFTFSSLDLYKRGVAKNFGYAHEAFTAEWDLPDYPGYRAGLFWITAEEMMSWARSEPARPLSAA